MSSKRQTRKTVVIDIERLRKNNADRSDKIAKLQAEIGADNAQIRELEKLRDTLYKAELQDKLSAVSKKKVLNDEQMLAFVEISKQLMDKIDVLDLRAVMEAISVDSMDTDLQPTKRPSPKPKAAKSEKSDFDILKEPEPESSEFNPLVTQDDD